MLSIPLQVIDGFLLKLNLGDALLVGFALGIPAVLLKKSGRLLSLHTILFGLLILIMPGSMYEPQELSFMSSILEYKLVGIVLLVVAPVLYATAKK
jgi:hypothetical protein